MAMEPQVLEFWNTEDPGFFLNMDPPESVVGWELEFTVLTRYWRFVTSSAHGSGITTTDGTLGRFTVTCAPLAPGQYLWFVMRTGTPRRLLAWGTMTVARAA